MSMAIRWVTRTARNKTFSGRPMILFCIIISSFNLTFPINANVIDLLQTIFCMACKWCTWHIQYGLDCEFSSCKITNKTSFQFKKKKRSCTFQVYHKSTHAHTTTICWMGVALLATKDSIKSSKRRFPCYTILGC